MDLPGFKEREEELKESLGEVQWWMEGEVTLAPSPSSHAQDTHTSAAMADRAGLTQNILDVIMILTTKA